MSKTNEQKSKDELVDIGNKNKKDIEEDKITETVLKPILRPRPPYPQKMKK